MKTLSFHEFTVASGPRGAGTPLLVLDTESQGLTWGPGSHLIVAPNGLGKSTLLRALAGQLSVGKGEARLDGRPLRPEREVVAVSEYLSFPKFIYPWEWVEFVSGRERAQLEPELRPWVEALRLGHRMEAFLGRMSQGERRKTTWLAAHASGKPVVLLDEPLDGLDLFGVEAARGLLREWKARGRIVVVVAHQVGEVLDLADHVWLIRDQRLWEWGEVMPGQGRTPDSLRREVLRFYSSARREPG
jgi:ABC-type multidrug transport system ATPase subunit